MGSNDFIDLIEKGMLDKLADVHTVTIGKITKVNAKTIDVKPVFKRKVDDREIEYPVFTNIPPIFLNGGTNYISFPLTVGDDVLLVINERCYDNWYEGLNNKTPLEYRMFDYSDSFALVGIRPKSKAIVIPTDGRTNFIGDTYIEGDYEHIGEMERIGNTNLVGNLIVNGNLTVNGNITINGGDLTVDGISFKQHVHLQNNGNDLGGGVNTNPPSNP